MVAFFQHRLGHYLLLTLAASLLFFWNLGGATLWDLDEGRNCTAAWEMKEANDWVVPTFNGQLRVDKPVLIYWLQMIGYHIGGVNETTGRLPSALAALATLLVAYELGRGMFSKTTGLLAGLAAGSSPMLIGAARFANPDALLNFFTALTLFLFWLTVQRPSAWRFALTGAAAGFAVLAKGPVGLVLPGAVMIGFLFWERRLGFFWDRRVLLGILVFVVVAVPWYAAVGAATRGEFLREFLWKHNIGRATQTMEGHRGSILYYPLVLLVGTFPWSLFAAGTIWATYWSCRQPVDSNLSSRVHAAADGSGRGGTAAYRFLAVWLLAYLVFFSASATKLPNYVLPALVPWTLLSARFLDRWRKETLTLPTWFFGLAIGILALVGLGLGSGLAVAAGVGQFDFLRNRFFPGLLPFAFMGLIPIVAAGLLTWTLRTGRRHLFVQTLTVAAVLLLAPLAAWASVVFNIAKTPEPLARFTDAGRTDIDQRVVTLNQGHLPSLNFYLRREVTHVLSLEEIATHLKMPVPVFALLALDAAEDFQCRYPGVGHEVSRQSELYRGKTLVVLSNR